MSSVMLRVCKAGRGVGVCNSLLQRTDESDVDATSKTADQLWMVFDVRMPIDTHNIYIYRCIYSYICVSIFASVHILRRIFSDCFVPEPNPNDDQGQETRKQSCRCGSAKARCSETK